MIEVLLFSNYNYPVLRKSIFSSKNMSRQRCSHIKRNVSNAKDCSRIMCILLARSPVQWWCSGGANCRSERVNWILHWITRKYSYTLIRLIFIPTFTTPKSNVITIEFIFLRHHYTIYEFVVVLFGIKENYAKI